MPTDPFVPSELDDRPRQQQNLAPGVHMPPAHGVAGRPARRPRRRPAHAATLLGTPGPERRATRSTLAGRLTRPRSGSSRTSTPTTRSRSSPSWRMKRAASFGRAPTMPDVDVAVELLGYAGRRRRRTFAALAAAAWCTAPTTSTACGARSSTRCPTRCCGMPAAGAGARSPSCAHVAPSRRARRPLTADGAAAWSASGSRPRRRARSTSAAPAPRCSTGSTPATRGGTFLLRIEDTDVARTPRRSGSTGSRTTLRWLGLDWDEGPCLQSDAVRRVPRGRRRGCSRQGDAYECYCTEDEVASATTPRRGGPPPGLRRPLPRPRPPTSARALAAEGAAHDPVPHARRRA